MKVGWTKEQLKAIDARGTGMIVSAAAGSGKTAVLVERLIKILADDENCVPADRLVVVTFTNDAAAQMKQRLSEALAQKLLDDPDNEWLCSQQALLQNAKISTIHSFCFDLIRENIHLTDVSAGFRILDDPEEKMLQRNAAAAAFESFYTEQFDTMQLLCDFFSGRSRGDDNLEQMVLDIYKYLSSIPFYDDWMKEQTERYSSGFDPKSDPFAEVYKEHLENVYGTALEQINFANDLLAGKIGGASDILENEKQVVSSLLKSLKNNTEWDKMIAPVNMGFPAIDIPTKLEEEKAAVRRKIVNIRKWYTKALTDISEGIFRFQDINDDYKKHSEMLEKLFSLIKRFDAELHRLKKERNALGFSDAEQIAVSLLAEKDGNGQIVKTRLAEELSGYYELIMIDEFQDANNNQDIIFKMLSRGGTAEKGGTNLFTVGDVKQSIYRFRLANPKLFLNALAVSEEYTDGDFQGTNASVTLNRNFRSSQEVIDFVNYVFGKLMSKRVGEVDYDSSEALVYGLNYQPKDRTTEIIIVPDGNADKAPSGDKDGEKKSRTKKSSGSKAESADEISEEDKEKKIASIMEKRTVFSSGEADNDGQDDQDPQDGDSGNSSEARAVAMKIRSMLGEKDGNGVFRNGTEVFTKDGMRPCEPRDFCILLRKSKNADQYVKELAALGIKAYAEEPKGYLTSREISVLMSMLAVIDNPMQDIHLAAVLMSPMFMLDAEDMAKLAGFRGEDEKYFTVIRNVLDGKTGITKDSPIFARLERFMDRFEKLRYCAVSQRLERFIRTIYDSTDLLSSVQVYKDGRQKKANLRLLLDIAEKYENNSDGGISGFVRYMDTLLKKGEDLNRASTVSSNENAVSVKTIHRSKGLEYPFVFLCETSDKFNTSDTKDNMQINSENGIAFRIQDRKALKRYNSFPRFVISEINKRNSVSEEMRLLYVALTRAREQLFITIPGSKPIRTRIDNICMKIQISKGITDGLAAEAGSMLDWISAAMLVHPDGEWFRGGEELPLETTDAKVRVSIFSEDPAAAEETEEQEAKPDENAVRKLEEMFAFGYHDERTEQSAKITVTEIVKSETEDKLFLRNPNFAGRGELTPAEKGTAMHTFMQYAEYSDAEKDPVSAANELVEKGILTEAERDSLNIGHLRKFFESELYKRIKNAYGKNPDMVRREQKFLIKKIDAGLLDDKRLMGYNNDSMIQGIADCMFEEDGKIILVDYKTDRLKKKGRPPEDTEKDFVSQYDLQIKLYAAALKKIFGKEVGEAYLYSFDLDKAVRVI